MIIRLLEYNWTNDDSGLEKPNHIGAYTEENYDKAIIFIKEMIDHGVRFGDDWYTVCDVIWSFPESRENIPSIDVYVTEGYDSN